MTTTAKHEDEEGRRRNSDHFSFIYDKWVNPCKVLLILKMYPTARTQLDILVGELMRLGNRSRYLSVAML